MSRADLIRSLSAPPEAIEADLVDQLADASAALERLRAATPSVPDAAWSRHYAQNQNLFHKALTALLKFRMANPSHVPSQPEAPIPSAPAPTPPTASIPIPTPRPPLDLSHLNRHQRRQLEALLRDSPERRRQRAAAAPAAPASRLPDTNHDRPLVTSVP